MEVTDIEEVGTSLAPIERAALALESTKTEAHLMALATKHASITLVKDRAGREQAHGAYIEVMRARTAVEKAAKDAREDATAHLHAVLTDRQAQEAEAARIKAEQEAEAARLKAEREELARQQAEAAAAIQKQRDELIAQRAAVEAEAQQRRADEDRAIAKVRAAAEAMAAERAEFERQKAELEAKAKPVEQEAANDFHRDAEPDLMQHTSPMFRGLAPEPFTTSEERDAVALIVKDVPAPAPVASAIVQAVAVYWDTDNKTAARWITERAAEIESLQ